MTKILICDDAAYARLILRKYLEATGTYCIIEATNGKEAVKLYKKEKPDLVTMDITMPEMDGLCALKKIVKADPMAKVIMCTAVCNQETILEAINTGARDYIIKPFTEDKLISAVERILR